MTELSVSAAPVRIEPPALVGFVGTGVMGAAMATRLLDVGYRLRVHNRTRAKAAALIDNGAEWAESAGEAVEGAAAVISIVGTQHDVRSAYLDPGGILDRCPAGCVTIDMTTSEPSLAVEIAARAAGEGVLALDAPVSGGDIGARDGTLSIMVGGDTAALERVRPVLDRLGTTIVHQGGAGSGQHTKMANQVAVASTTVAVMEALAYALGAGLDPEKVLQSIGQGAAGSWAMARLFPRAAAGDFAPGFAIRHFAKDLDIAAREADAMGLHFGGLALARGLLHDLESEGAGEDGTQALIRVVGR